MENLILSSVYKTEEFKQWENQIIKNHGRKYCNEIWNSGQIEKIFLKQTGRIDLFKKQQRPREKTKKRKKPVSI